MRHLARGFPSSKRPRGSRARPFGYLPQREGVAPSLDRLRESKAQSVRLAGFGKEPPGFYGGKRWKSQKPIRVLSHAGLQWKGCEALPAEVFTPVRQEFDRNATTLRLVPRTRISSPEGRLARSARAAPDTMTNSPSYDLRDYPAGLEEFLNTFPPERRAEVRAAVLDLHLRSKSEAAWVDQQVRGMLELPDVIYKYIPFQHVERYGLPMTLRATQPSALNDVMEGNIDTVAQGKVRDRDAWYDLILSELRAAFGRDVLSDDEMRRRKKLFGAPRVSTIIRDYLSRHVGVISFSADPLILTMWAHYSRNSGLVIGYSTAAMKALGVDLRRMLYLELPPSYTPSRDNVVRLQFVDEERRRQRAEAGETTAGTPLLSSEVEFCELRADWRELARVLFVKGHTWQYEREVRLLVELAAARPNGDTKDGYAVHVVDVPADAIEEVYVGTDTPDAVVRRIHEVVGVGEGQWRLKRTDAHAYRMQVTSTSISNRRSPEGSRN